MQWCRWWHKDLSHCHWGAGLLFRPSYGVPKSLWECKWALTIWQAQNHQFWLIKDWEMQYFMPVWLWEHHHWAVVEEAGGGKRMMRVWNTETSWTSPLFVQNAFLWRWLLSEMWVLHQPCTSTGCSPAVVCLAVLEWVDGFIFPALNFTTGAQLASSGRVLQWECAGALNSRSCSCTTRNKTPQQAVVTWIYTGTAGNGSGWLCWWLTWTVSELLTWTDKLAGAVLSPCLAKT